MTEALRDRQAAYAAWLDRERQRAALDGARCELCVFWAALYSAASHHEPIGSGVCHHASSASSTAENVRGSGWWCEHYLPRAEHDRRPAGGVSPPPNRTGLAE